MPAGGRCDVSGAQLYALYVTANEEQGCGVDAWEELDDRDRAMWERVAQLASGEEG